MTDNKEARIFCETAQRIREIIVKKTRFVTDFIVNIKESVILDWYKNTKQYIVFY